MKRVLFATGNPHKVEEARAILGAVGIRVEALGSLSQVPPEPEETGATFADNARLKARYYAKQTGQACLAEDSGLAVDALGGAPGVFSARYAAAEGSRSERDAANNAKLLAALHGVAPEHRAARFVSAACLARPDGEVLAEAEGVLEGCVATAPRGGGGFGYDPLFWLPDAQCTSAELTPEQKNARSHRGRALRELASLAAELAV